MGAGVRRARCRGRALAHPPAQRHGRRPARGRGRRRRLEARLGAAIRESESHGYAELIDEVRPLPGARELLAGLRSLGYRVVLASSADSEEVERYVGMLDAHELVDAWTSAADVERTKPHPDLVATAAERLPGARTLVMIGDSAWDAVAAKRADVPSIGLLSGGFGAAELRDAGCAAVYADAAELAANLRDALDTASASGTTAAA